MPNPCKGLKSRHFGVVEGSNSTTVPDDDSEKRIVFPLNSKIKGSSADPGVVSRSKCRTFSILHFPFSVFNSLVAASGSSFGVSATRGVTPTSPNTTASIKTCTRFIIPSVVLGSSAELVSNSTHLGAIYHRRQFRRERPAEVVLRQSLASESLRKSSANYSTNGPRASFPDLQTDQTSSGLFTPLPPLFSTCV